MSTMLKTAAMTLLSKTLQTFLYKYLSDVDVEGVALPSVYDGSGWGVRLSNVKLREGVQLMKELPGKVKKKRRKKKKKKKKRREKIMDEQQTQQNTINNNNNNQDIENGNRSFFRGAEVDPDAEMVDESLHVRDLQRKTSKDFLEEGDKDHYYDDAPGTPEQNSKSIFSCFQNSRSAVATAPQSDGGDPQQQPRNLPEIPLHQNETVEQRQPPLRVESELTFDDGESFANKTDTETADLVHKIDVALEDGEMQDEEQYEKGEKVQEEEEEEEFEEYEQPLKLTLGENGRIGTLDIRLIGKELHVLVEDAVLTIEATPIVEDDENDDDDGTRGGEQRADEDAASKVSGQQDHTASAPEEPKPKEKKKAEPKRATVGDRVMADNPLARAIASIPHLFLRDIRIRLIIRNEPRREKTEVDEDTEPQENADMGISEEDCMLEIGIEFLSVTSGEDVLSHFQQQPDDENDDESEHSSVRPPMNSIHSFSSIDNTLDQNEYLIRHIRTGRGPSAGLSVQLFSPGKQTAPWDGRSDFIWARQQWMLATEFYLLRCSGLDIRARIPLGTKKEVAAYSWFYGDQDEGEIEYDENTLDSLLFGLDHVAPGPQLPLPPISPHMSRGNTPRGKVQDQNPSLEQERGSTHHAGGADSFYVDQNGIQSCQIPSSFHRVARGMLPGSAKDCNHLPSQICPKCWEAPHGVAKTSDLDDSIPLPGLALQITMRDPLEVNVDRSSLETIGMLKSLFQKKKKVTVELDPEPSAKEETTEPDTEQSPPNEDGATETTAPVSLFGSMLTKKKEEDPVKETIEPSDSFAEYMQPENVQVLGIHLSKVQFRLHLMSETDNDNNMSFCYWDVMMNCLTLDQQALKSKEKIFQDVRLDVGNLTWHEYRGIDRTEMFSLGIPYPERQRANSNSTYISVATVATVPETKEQSQTPWPSTACALMDVPPPLETVIYKSRERHGAQIRFVSIANVRQREFPVKSFVNVRLGVMSLNGSWGFWRNFGAIRREIIKSLAGNKPTDPEADPSSKVGPGSDAEGPDKKQDETKPEPPPIKKVMKYKVQLDGGSMILQPVLRTKLPLTQFCGEQSTDSGIFIESIFDKLQFAYGRKNESVAGQLDVQRLAALPENVRMRVLLCLDDLGPLEEAFQVKAESNSFKRCRAVNKGIPKMARKLRKAKQKLNRSNADDEGSSRRQQIMNDFMKMSDDELNELWAVHQKHKRKVARGKAKSAL